MHDDFNIVTLKGRVFSEPKDTIDNTNHKVKTMIVKCKRFSGVEDNVVVHLPFSFDRQVKVGDAIEINGQFRSYNQDYGDSRRLILYVQPVLLEKLGILSEDENIISLKGTICKPPIYRKTPLTDREITDFMIAVNRPEGGADFVPCIAWGYNALALKTACVGDRVAVQGRIQSREYAKIHEDGRREVRTAYEISCGKLHFEMNINYPDRNK